MDHSKRALYEPKELIKTKIDLYFMLNDKKKKEKKTLLSKIKNFFGLS